MAKTKKADERLRIHNKGQREFRIPPAKEGKKERMLYPNRAVEIEKDLALKLIKSYPNDLCEFDSLVTGEKKDLNREIARLEAEKETLEKKVADLEKKANEKVDPVPETDVKKPSSKKD